MAAATSFVLSRVGDVDVAIEAAQVLAIDAESGALPSVELASMLGLVRGAGRRLTIAGDSPWELVVGSEVRVEAVIASRLLPLPHFLGGLRRQRGIVGLVSEGDGFACLIDVGAIRELARPDVPHA